MAAREKGGRVVFIGNIPYGVSEEQICEIFGRVGSVVNFRLVYDKETQRPKGFGFLEYTDVDAAASAVRNLNDFEIMGRTLRVDYSNDNGGGKGGQRDGQRDGGEGGGRAPPPAHFNMNAPPQTNGGDPAALPPLPPGQPLQDGLTAPDAISRTLQAIPAPQLLDIISQMKNMSIVNPAQATALLASAPQLGYAIFQALLLLGLVDTNILGSLISQPGQAPPPQQQQLPPQQPPPSMQYQQPPPQQMPPQPLYAQPPPQYQTQPPQQAYQQPPPKAYAPTPPVQHPAYQPPPPPQQQQPASLPGVAPEQQAIIQQILAMSREHIFSLDEGPRNQILAIRAQFGAPVV
ncbi:hypothetical protein B0A55_00259 [Friedmanniomyces simplex]|uniref:RRM domain-containing protein n=1 Tax=Friedmanniomyces simplex TaxID=329884 RepID=A0A4U0Y2P6_9PEZI|nr:hypothetical protein B0A55_00259 [Friedmanniomyces simplex]